MGVFFNCIYTRNLSRMAGVWYLCQFSEEALAFYPFRSFYVYLDGARAVWRIGWGLDGRSGVEKVEALWALALFIRSGLAEGVQEETVLH